ncbi:hypothetical protein MIR68_002493 [Amoeboaphelidium protococcarum]|nr:hypothetical protein MIR68_002493 [Amoeboaphelidium protococcarum]
MSVLLETSVGQFVIDLYCEEFPDACKQFLRLCRDRFYDYATVQRIEPGFIVQFQIDKTGHSIAYHKLNLQRKPLTLKHNRRGLLSINCVSNNGEQILQFDQFFITLGDDLEYLDDGNQIIGRIEENIEILDILEQSLVDGNCKLLLPVAISHTHILLNPFDPQVQHVALDRYNVSLPPLDLQNLVRLGQQQNDGSDADDVIKDSRLIEEVHIGALLTQYADKYVDDLDEELDPKVLFVGNLNHATTEGDLHQLFQRFGPVRFCKLATDKLSWRPLGYAFVGFRSDDVALKAKQSADGIHLDDKVLRVNFARVKAQTQITHKQSNPASAQDFAGYNLLL